jgi:DHA1 family bicyclomycin/chloramphenicol resistance-like MFS transporter
MPRFAAPDRALHFTELVLLLAALMSMVAFSIDSILPGLPDIAAAFGTDASHAQLVISAFIMGFGIGQFFFGPFSDSFGRRGALILGVSLYVTGALTARSAGSIEALFAARAIQGLGAAASRVVSQAVMRDLFSGRMQARVGSLVFTFFVMVPALAPLIGQQIILASSWRGLFTTYAVFGIAVVGWFLIRQPETLAPENRRSFRLGPVLRAGREVITNPVAARYLVVATLGFGQLMAYISSAQQIYVDALGAGRLFPLFFAATAVLSSASGFINSRLVMRLGMRPLASWAFGSQVIMSVLYWAAWHFGALTGLPAPVQLGVFVAWSVTLFFMNGLTFGNVTALAMEPLGHIAGTAAAVVGAMSSILGAGIAAPVGLAFDGTPRPLVGAVAVCSAIAFALVWSDRKRER